MKLLRQGSTIKVTKPKDVEDFIKDLLESPEALGKKMFVTKLIFSASGVDGNKLRENILDWLETPKEQGDINESDFKDLRPGIAIRTKPSWKKEKPNAKGEITKST